MALFPLTSTIKALSGLALAGALATGVTTVSQAAEPIETAQSSKSLKGERRHENRIHRVCASLKCTDAQKAELAKIASDMREATKAEREGLRNDNKALAAEMRAERIDRREVDRLFNSMESHRSQIADAAADAMVATHDVLTPEQREQLAKKIEHRGPKGMLGGGHGKHKGKFGKHHGKGKRGDKDKAHGKHKRDRGAKKSKPERG